MATSKSSSPSGVVNTNGSYKEEGLLCYKVSYFNGLNTETKDVHTLDPSFSPDSLNWLTTSKNDSIQLRRGIQPLAPEDDLGAGQVTGLAVGETFGGVEIPFFTFAQKVMRFDLASLSYIETGANIIPAAAGSINMSVVPYKNLAGSFLYLMNPYMEAIKIPLANPGSYRSQINYDFHGYFDVHQSRAFLLQRNGQNNQNDPMSLYLSWIDKQLFSDYTFNGGQNFGTGDGATKTFTGPVSVAGGGTTVFGVSIYAPVVAGVAISGITAASNAVVATSAPHGLSQSDPVLINGVVGMTQINNILGYVTSVVDTTHVAISIDSTSFTAYSSAGNIFKSEVFTDNKDGVLKSLAGGTGTIDYSTYVAVVNFNTAPINGQEIFYDCFSEDAGSEGILDFTITYIDDPGQPDNGGRTPGTGDQMPQYEDGGNLTAVIPFANIYAAFHQKKTWQVVIPTDDSDTGRTNLPFREKMGAPNPWSIFGGTLGVYFVDVSNPQKPEFRVIEAITGGAQNTNTLVPTLLTQLIDLSPYAFDQAVVYEWSDYVLFSCQRIQNGTADGFNSFSFVYNLKAKAWDLIKNFANRYADYYGSLLMGSSIDNNLYVMFSGFSDGDAAIENYYTTGSLDLDWEGEKKLKKLLLKGLIQSDQAFDVYISFDDGTFVKYFTVLGTGPYVNSGVLTDVGSLTLGTGVVGAGGEVFASPFAVEIPINSDRFVYARLKFEACVNTAADGQTPSYGIGFVQINSIDFKDIRIKSSRVRPLQTVTATVVV